MQSKIPCTADRLSLLDPQMIQAITDTSAFQIGRKYLTENRVRIAEATDTQVSSAVIGNAGIYEQTIQLTDGHLMATCSCTRQEKPLCHHCIAALLEYHRLAKPQPSRKSTPPTQSKSLPQANPSTKGRPSRTQSTVSDMKLGEIAKFMEWLQLAMNAVKNEQPFPDPPVLEPGEISTWVLAIKSLEERRRESASVLASLESEIRRREAYTETITQQLHTSMAELKSAQTTSQGLEREAATYKEALAQLSQLTNDVARYDDQIRAAAQDIIQNGSHVEKLAGSFKEVVEGLNAPPAPMPQE
jgi:hypothetical protein